MKKICLILLAALCGLTWAELDLLEFCLDRTANKVLAHPEDCRGYIVCSKEPSVHYCEQGFHFDSEHMVCDWPENINCNLLPQSNEVSQEVVKPPFFTSFMALDIMTGEVVNPMIGYDPLNVVCRHFGAYFLPNPKHCRSYYLCAYGHMHEHSCGPNTLWNYTTQQCVSSHVAVCYELSKDEEKEINENNSVVCYPVNKTITTTTDAFNSIDTTPSTTAAIPVPPLMTQTYPPTSSKKPNFSNPYHIICPSKRQSYVAHPKDCSKYFMCIMGIPVMTSCPDGLLWDAQKEYCIFSGNVKCYQEKNTSVKLTKE